MRLVLLIIQPAIADILCNGMTYLFRHLIGLKTSHLSAVCMEFGVVILSLVLAWYCIGAFTQVANFLTPLKGAAPTKVFGWPLAYYHSSDRFQYAENGKALAESYISVPALSFDFACAWLIVQAFVYIALTVVTGWQSRKFLEKFTSTISFGMVSVLIISIGFYLAYGYSQTPAMRHFDTQLRKTVDETDSKVKLIH